MLKKIYNKVILSNFVLNHVIRAYRMIGLPQSKKNSSFFSEKWHEGIDKSRSNFNRIKEKLNIACDIPFEFIDQLAKITQVTDKETEINWAHGYLLYGLVFEMAVKHSDPLTIIEVGTARGFSSLCMAKALHDAKRYGKIITIDIVNHENQIYWNTIGDETKRTRYELLSDYKELTNLYITYITGKSNFIMPLLSVGNVNFAFLDGSHFYEDVKFEYEWLKGRLDNNGMIVFDDYDPKFPEIQRLVDDLKRNNNIEIVYSSDDRGYGILRKNNDI